MKLLISSLLLFSYLGIYSSIASAVTMPCSMVLEPVEQNLPNAKGAALVYQVQLRPPSFARTNISIFGVHIPMPSSYGNYDSYEGFAFIPDQISWRFPLYVTDDNHVWAGKFDEITASLDEAEVQIRLSNSKTKKLGPSVLGRKINECK